MKLYLYVFDTLADWEIAYLTAEFTSGRYFADPRQSRELVLVADSLSPVRTMGGLVLHPDLSLDAFDLLSGDMFVLPGGEGWENPSRDGALAAARLRLENGLPVAAICGATMGLARAGLLETRLHTSNDLGYLQAVAPDYHGAELFRWQPAVADGPLITATGLAPVEFAHEILKALNVFRPATLEAWKDLYLQRSGEAYGRLMQSLA